MLHCITFIFIEHYISDLPSRKYLVNFWLIHVVLTKYFLPARRENAYISGVDRRVVRAGTRRM